MATRLWRGRAETLAASALLASLEDRQGKREAQGLWADDGKEEQSQSQPFDRKRKRNPTAIPKSRSGVVRTEAKGQAKINSKASRRKPKAISRAPADVDSPEELEYNDNPCAICNDHWVLPDILDDAFLFCDGCEQEFHLSCYGFVEVDAQGPWRARVPKEDPWFCELCAFQHRQWELKQQELNKQQHQENETQIRGVALVKQALVPPPQPDFHPVPCQICYQTQKGVMKRTDQDQWAHMVCGYWIEPCYYKDHVTMTTICGVEDIKLERATLKCSVCHNTGACVQCSHGKCTVSFHPLCARKDQGIKLLDKAADYNFEKVCKVAFCRQHADREETFDYDKHAKALWQKRGRKTQRRMDSNDNTEAHKEATRQKPKTRTTARKSPAPFQSQSAAGVGSSRSAAAAAESDTGTGTGKLSRQNTRSHQAQRQRPQQHIEDEVRIAVRRAFAQVQVTLPGLTEPCKLGWDRGVSIENSLFDHVQGDVVEYNSSFREYLGNLRLSEDLRNAVFQNIISPQHYPTLTVPEMALDAEGLKRLGEAWQVKQILQELQEVKGDDDLAEPKQGAGAQSPVATAAKRRRVKPSAPISDDMEEEDDARTKRDRG